MLETEGFTILRLEPVGRVFSSLATRLAEKWFNLARKFFFFLPKRARAYASFPFVAPVTWLLYSLARLLDLTNRRNVFFFAVLAEKPATK